MEEMKGMENRFYRSAVKIALPVTLQSLLQSSFSVIDQMMIGWLGSYCVAGVGLGGNFDRKDTGTGGIQ